MACECSVFLGAATYEEMIAALYSALEHVRHSYYNNPYYDKLYVDDGGEKKIELSKSIADYEPISIIHVYRTNPSLLR